jgi:hypothetical protein
MAGKIRHRPVFLGADFANPQASPDAPDQASLVLSVACSLPSASRKADGKLPRLVSVFPPDQKARHRAALSNMGVRMVTQY